MQSNRLKLLRNSLKLSQKDMGKLFDVSQTTYSYYEKEDVTLPDKLKDILLDKCNINLNWLITGKGSMYLDNQDNYVEDVTNENTVFRNAKGHELSINKNNTDKIINVTVYNQFVSAGKGENWLSDLEDTYVIKLPDYFIKGCKNAIGLKVRGDSMKDIFLNNGDIVLMDKTDTIVDGMYILSIDNELYVKTLEYEPIGRVVRVISHNKNFKTIEVSADDERITILGKVVGWIHKA